MNFLTRAWLSVFFFCIFGLVIISMFTAADDQPEHCIPGQVAEELPARELEHWQQRENCIKDGSAYIGEPQERTVKCGWGKPRKINRTITEYGVREQWVYNGGYLYFKDGILTSIQN